MNRLVRRVTYEWDYESFDEHGDIVDHNFSDTCPGIPAQGPENLCGDEVGINLVLVRDVHEGYSDDFNNTADLYDRTWCYVKGGVLPTHFSDSMGVAIYPVPKRLREEFARSVR